VKKVAFIFLCLVTSFSFSQSACDCNPQEIQFSDAYVNTQQVVFLGKTVSVSKGTDYNKATFFIQQLFKGTASQKFDVYFESKDNCSLKFNEGEDWLIYANYKRGKALAVYCSRCRKNVINTNKNVDLTYVKNDLSFDEEVEKLSELLGKQNFSKGITNSETMHNNIIPNGWQRIVLIIVSAVGLVLAYIALDRVFRK
jgi:hypothetical protein